MRFKFQYLGVAAALIVFGVAVRGFAKPEATPTPKSGLVTPEKGESLVDLNRTVFGAYVMDIKIQTTLERGPLTKKIFRETSIHFDQSGRWHLIKVDPLQNDRWEIFYLGGDERKFYLRKNKEPLRFAADPVELSRWLETSLRDFYQLVQEPRQKLVANEIKQVKKTKLLERDARCLDSEAGGKTTHLCVDEETGAILDGSYSVTKSESADAYPLTTTIDAALTVRSFGAAVKPVAAPVQN